MNSLQKIGIVVTVTTTVGLAALGICFFSAGAGHGSYFPFAILLPYSFLPSLFASETDAVSGPLAIVQFPLYGIVLGRAWLKGDLRWSASWVIGAHVVAALAALTMFFRT
jgi:hypothetical protein